MPHLVFFCLVRFIGELDSPAFLVQGLYGQNPFIYGMEISWLPEIAGCSSVGLFLMALTNLWLIPVLLCLVDARSLRTGLASESGSRHDRMDTCKTWIYM